MEIAPELLAMGMDEDDARNMSIFAPYNVARLSAVITDQTRFVHYTSAEVAMSILSDESIWMRSVATMNDFSEVEYGSSLLKTVWSSETGTRLQAALLGLFPEAIAEAEKLFNDWALDFKHGTYITCLSEHATSEDQNGRLSMWRAYGGTTGVALVINQRPMASASDALNSYSSPVCYWTLAEVTAHFEQITRNIIQDAEFLATMGPDNIRDQLFTLFRSTAITTKHPGFAEEREWRVIHAPALAPSPRVLPYIRSVRGVPQTIYKLPLKSIPEEGMVGLDIPDLIDRVIIGPTDHGYAIAEAFVRQLRERGVPDPWQRVHRSDIPLRNP